MVIQPENAADVAAALRRAADARQSIVIRGAGTKSSWGRIPSRVDAVLDMRRLNRILAHDHGDLTATIEAGASLREVNAALAVHRQVLPLDPPFADHATIGGLLATNDSGPLRHRYGTPRDLVIGIQLATTDGVLSNAGGKVVKNVAGYDLGKLVTGSFGSLAAIVSATFKLSPLPVASKTMRIEARDAAAVADIVGIVMASQLEPVAFELRVGTPTPQSTPSEELSAISADATPHIVQAFRPAVLIRFATLPEVVNAQIEQARAVLKACTTSIEVLDGVAEQSAWIGHATAVWDAAGAVVRASWLPANIALALGELDRIAAEVDACATSLVGRAAVGAGHIVIDGVPAAQASAIERLRASQVFGNVVIVRASAELKSLVDVWGSHGDRQPLFDSLKRAFDPNGVLNAGRGPL